MYVCAFLFFQTTPYWQYGFYVLVSIIVYVYDWRTHCETELKISIAEMKTMVQRLVTLTEVTFSPPPLPESIEPQTEV